MKAKTLRERIFEKIEMEPMSGCWLWTGYLQRGVPSILLAKRNARVRHVMFEMEIGPLPEGAAIKIFMRCRSQLCVCPHHFVAASIMATYPCGHERTERNSQVTKTGGTACKQCRALGLRRREMARAFRDGRWGNFRVVTHYPCGHSRVSENTITSRWASPRCRECWRVKQGQYRRAKHTGVTI